MEVAGSLIAGEFDLVVFMTGVGVRALVEKYVHGRILWIFGQPYVNVLEVNMALDAGEAG